MRIHALRLQAPDPDTLGEFYRDSFGLDTSPASDGVVVSVGTTDLTFERAPREMSPFYHFAITIPKNRFDDAYEWLDDRVGVLADVETGRTRFEFGDYLDATACYFRDPAGNLGELIARHRLDNADSEGGSFGPQQLLAVSEIGLVVDDVPLVAAELAELAGVADLGGGRAFRMLGDQRGTFILVDEGRPWFVGGDDPGVFPTVVVADVDADYDVPGHPYRIRRA